MSIRAELPNVSLIVLNFNGKQHLAECLPSLSQLDYPADKLEVVVVDNASTDGSARYVQAQHPHIRLVQNAENLGFATGNNLGAQAATGQYVVFLNNDMWVERRFVAELVAAIHSGPEVVCAGAKILNWDGTRLDFAGSSVHFTGNGFQTGFGQPFKPDQFNERRPMLFACGGAMMVDRQVFLEAGSFDDDYFIYFEDVDLGWRLWLLGYQVVFAPQAIVYHRHHGTMSGFSDHRKRVLYKRNSLYTIIKNYDEANLGRILPATLLGTVDAVVQSTVQRGHLDPKDYFIKSKLRLNGAIKMAPDDVSSLMAIRDVVQHLPQVMEKRRLIQSRRRRSDEEISSLFRRPFLHWPDIEAQTHYAIAEAFDVQSLFENVPRRVLIISSDILPYPGLPTVGSGLRAWALGQGLKSAGHEVAFSMPRAALVGRESLVSPEVAHLAWDQESLVEVVREADPDIVVVCNWPILDWLPTELLPMPIVLDQHGPHLLEREYQHFGNQHDNAQRKINAVQKADFFSCAGKRQLAYFQAWLERAGWTEQERRERASVIPVSLSPDMPAHLARGELTFVYGGVFLPWQDPSAALSGLVEALDQRQTGVLHIFGGHHPFISIDSGVFDTLVEQLSKSPRVVRHAMTPHAELISHYTGAHVAIDVMQRNPERELAFTTRTVEYLWCGLPVIYNDYSELSEHIREYDAGWLVDPTDRHALAGVLNEIFEHPEQAAQRSRNAQCLVRDRFTWDRTIAPLDAFVRHPRMRQHARPKPTPRTIARSAPYLLKTAWAMYRQRGPGAVWQTGRRFLSRQFRRT
jgi:GT2 family glycosyltransferase